MAEDTEGHEHGAATAGVDPAALSLALGAATSNERVAAQAEAFLEKQSRLADLQIEELRREDRVRHWSLRVRHINDVMKLAFAFSVAFIFLVAAVSAGALVWSAYDAKGLVVQPLKVPPDFEVRGLDGNVLAQQLLDRLNALVTKAEVYSFRRSESISGDWGDNSKVEIPETGVSITELSRELKTWLGSETRASGEIWRTANGLTISMRVAGQPALTFEGTEKDLDKLLDRMALALLRQTQPFRYGNLFIETDHRNAETVFRELAATATSDNEHGWALISLANVLALGNGKNREALSLGDEAISLMPQNPAAYTFRENAHMALGHTEMVISDLKHQLALPDEAWSRDMTPSIVAVLKLNSRAWLYELQGAFSDAIAPNLAQANQPNFHIDAVIWAQLASDLARDHDPRAAKTMLDQHHIDIANAARNVLVEDFAVPPHAAVHLEDDKPRAAVDDLRLGDEVALKLGNESDIRHALFWPWLSYALARSGDAKAARALIARTPHDCTLCLEMRGRVAELGGDMKGAALWYARAVADAPSIPFTYTDWGAMLLHKGDYDGAIAKFTVANQKGPHFADPLEMWGEALMLKNRSDLALAKFEDANKYAPNWGRLHMKWGEALGYVGRKDEARAQYRIASTLDLSVADQAELTRDMRG